MAQNNDKNPVLTVKQAAHLSGLSVHMITYLGRIDILKPSCGGRGKVRQFTFGDMLFLRLISDMLAKGIEVTRLRKSLAKLRAHTEVWNDIRSAPGRYLITDGTELFVQREGELESKTMNGQMAFAFVLDLKFAHRSVASAWPQSSKSRKVRRSSKS
jgi:DNA-binding transcriptional MerR regulator